MSKNKVKTGSSGKPAAVRVQVGDSSSLAWRKSIKVKVEKKKS